MSVRLLFERFRPEHLNSLVLQPSQASTYADFSNNGYGEALATHESYTGFVDERVAICVGMIEIWEGRAELWALIAHDIGAKSMHSLHYTAKAWLAQCKYRRVEAHCDAEFGQAHRWLRLLGFEYEGPLAKYTPDGRDCLRFARVR